MSIMSQMVKDAFARGAVALSDGLGDPVQYEGKNVNGTVLAIVNRTTDIRDPNGGTGGQVVETEVTAMIHQSQVANPYAHRDKGDVITEADGSKWRIASLMPPHANRFGFFRCILTDSEGTGF